MSALRLLSIFSLLLLATTADAARTVTVDTTVDEIARSTCDDATPDDCSLRGAIKSASLAAEHWEILLPSGTYTTTETGTCTFQFAYPSSPVTVTTTALCVRKDVAIIGAGADTTIIDGDHSWRVIEADANTTATISGVTIQHGYQFGSTGIGGGAGLVNHGVMTVTDSVFVANQANGGGGAIANMGDLILERCTLTGNEGGLAFGNGGGAIWNVGGVPFPRELTIIDSTLDHNVAYVGGAMYTKDSLITIIGSTFTANSADDVDGFACGGAIINTNGTTISILNSTFTENDAWQGGAVCTTGTNAIGKVTVTLENATIVGNIARRGGGISIGPNDPITVRNTILAGNTASTGFGPNALATLTSGGHNVFGSLANSVVTGDTTGDQMDVADPLLGALAFNGGPTATRAPLPTSPAIDHGSPAAPGSGSGACAATDQRHGLRPLGGRCDAGAVEASSIFTVTSLSPARSGNAGSAVVNVAGGGFVPGTVVALRRTGQADIVGSDVVVDAAGAALAASFDLTGAPTGPWDIVATNPDTISAALPASFTVEAAAAPDLHASVIGSRYLRVGFPARYTVFYENRGNAEALGVPITIGVPTAYGFALLSQLSAPPEQPGQPFNDYRDEPVRVLTVAGDEQQYVPLVVPIVPPRSSGFIDFSLTPPVGIPPRSTFLVEALIGDPWFDGGAPSADYLSDAAVRARQIATKYFNATPLPAIDAALIDYERNALTLMVTSSRSALLNAWGRGVPLFSVPHLAVDLAGYAAAQPPAMNLTLEELSRQIAVAVGVVTPVAGACGKCICDRPIEEGCSCDQKNCEKPGPDPKAPDKPPSPLECQEMGMRGGGDGRGCAPKPKTPCPLIPNPILADPGCLPTDPLGSIDPNAKYGPSGSGPAHYMIPEPVMPYAISFENQPEATLPAQTVVVTDHLDTATLDLATFALGPITVGDHTITPPPGLKTFTGDADLRPGQNVLMKVTAALDEQTGIVTWTFLSLDPTTQQVLDGSLEGFLPPNTAPPAGEGRVLFTVAPKAGLTTGTEIKNKATIVFDVNAPIETPEWVNTVDVTPPSSQVDSVGPCGASNLTVDWSGTDVGAGIAFYSVFVSTDGGPYVPLVTTTMDTSAPFTGEPGKTYRFYSSATDGAGNVEPAPTQPDLTRIAGSCGTHDLAITALKAPKKVALTTKKPSKVVKVTVEIQNRAPHPETIPDLATLANLVTLDVEPVQAGCGAPATTILSGKPKLPITVKSKKKTKVVFAVTIGCATDPAKGVGHEDYRLTAAVHRSTLGEPDSHPVDDVCPRSVTPPGIVDPYPDGKIKDKGCGAKKPDKTLGGDVLIDVTVK